MFLRRGFFLGSCYMPVVVLADLYDDIIITSRQLLVFCLGRKFSNYPSVPPYADELTCDGLMAKVPRRWPGSNEKGRRYVGLISLFKS
ncbi:hypothetical protein ASD60_10135 [Pseudomonas sp. Root562]|nr:hypothetical protein ASD60_10135 [Pseudomonas sp. Root562]